ncbi:MAG: L,D-transpeptidase family protein [Candidatus Peribacteria bacterium]|jgi:hypothetical protein|nr:L,D-transpeptidase family protein [Candidatus Peribacteria bacterium]
MLKNDSTFYIFSELLENLKGEDAVIQRPMSELLEGKYKNPLVMGGVARDMGALLGYNQADSILANYPQSRDSLTAKSKYQLTDTLSFPLIAPGLASAFPLFLEEQLQEEGFHYTGKDSLHLAENTSPYTIVVKRIEGGKHALALYKEGQRYLATHVSIGGRNGHTIRGLRSIDLHVPHKRSQKHDNAPMPYALHILGGTEGYYLHQGRVNGKPLSHGCVRVPGLYQEVMYHLVGDGSLILIDEHLYRSK